MYYLPFDPAPDVEEAFTYGDCWCLAKAIHDISGYPIVALGCSHTGPAECERDRDWHHMFVALPDGNLLDVRGIWSQEAMLSEWAENYKFCHPEDGPYYCLDFWLVEDWEDATSHQTPAYPENSPEETALDVLAQLDNAFVSC